MTVEIPTIEPAELVAGDTWSWKLSLSDYPAGTWVLTYYFRSREGEFSVVCTADGTDHLATVAAVTSATQKAGRYEWIARVASGGAAYTVRRGHVDVKPDPSKLGAGHDSRSHARKALEALEAQIEGRATKQQQEYTIGTRAVKYLTPDDLMKWRDYYRAEVAAEQAQENLNSGKPGASRLLARL